MPRKKRKGRQPVSDFRVITTLSERLSRFVRLLLHLTKMEWDACVSRIEQHKKETDQPEYNEICNPKLAYRTYYKSKGRGKGRRRFDVPCDELKEVQRKVFDRLLRQIPVHFTRYGNQPGESIISNASAHIGAQGVLTIDIMNAFPSTFRSRVKGILGHELRSTFLRQFGQGVGLSEEDKELILDAILDLVMYQDVLPQGPPTSPRLLDIACYAMDRDLWAYLHSIETPFQQYTLTMYADDISISSNKEIPPEVLDAVLKIIKSHNYIPYHPNDRPDKSRYMSPKTGEVPVITGLAVHSDRITMNRQKQRHIAHRLHQLCLVEDQWDLSQISQVSGLLGFVQQVYPEKLPSSMRNAVAIARERFETERVLHGPLAEYAEDGVPDDVISNLVSRAKQNPEPEPYEKKKKDGSAQEDDTETLEEILVPTPTRRGFFQKLKEFFV